MTKNARIGIFLAIFSMSGSAGLQAAAPDDKVGVPTDPQHSYTGTPAPGDTVTPPADKSKEPKTVPSGKRHRTHRKEKGQAQTTADNKTIQSGDVTPSY